MMFKKRKRLCWWCSSKLSSVSHAVVRGRLVHKICEAPAKESFRLLTAQPPIYAETDAALLYKTKGRT